MLTVKQCHEIGPWMIIFFLSSFSFCRECFTKLKLLMIAVQQNNEFDETE